METSVEAPKIINEEEFSDAQLASMLEAGEISLSQLTQKRAKEVMRLMSETVYTLRDIENMGKLLARDDLKIDLEQSIRGFLIKCIKNEIILNPYPSYSWYKKVRTARFWGFLVPNKVKQMYNRWKFRNSTMEDC